jgi:O-antigen/teichoic acid export membrane protein
MYAYVTTIANILALILSFDLGSAALRFVGIYYHNKQFELLRGFCVFSRISVITTSVGVSLFCALMLLLLRPIADEELAWGLLAACTLVPALAVLLLEANLLQATQRIAEAQVPGLLVRPIVMVSIVLISIGAGYAPSVGGVVLAQSAGALSAVGLSVIFWTRMLRQYSEHVGSRRTEIPEWLSFASVTLGSNLLYALLSQQADIIIVGSLIGANAAGLYSVASQLSSIILLGVSAILHVASPRIAALHHASDQKGLSELIWRVTLLNIVTSIPVIFLLVVGGNAILAVFGHGFSAAYPIMLVLLIGNVVNAAWGSLWGALLTMAGYKKAVAALVITAVGVNLVLTFILTPIYGPLGAAAATTAAVLLRSIIVAILIYNRLGFWPLNFGGLSKTLRRK